METKTPPLNKKYLSVSSLDEVAEEKSYWLARSPEERLNAVEYNRMMVYGEDRASSRLQRFLEVVELRGS